MYKNNQLFVNNCIPSLYLIYTELLETNIINMALKKTCILALLSMMALAIADAIDVSSRSATGKQI